MRILSASILFTLFSASLNIFLNTSTPSQFSSVLSAAYFAINSPFPIPISKFKGLLLPNISIHVKGLSLISG